MKAIKILTTVMCIWFVFSWFEIAFHSPFEPANYSNYNLIAPIIEHFA